MANFRKTLTWLFLASYGFANSLAASLHDHGDCCGPSECADHHAVQGAAGHDDDADQLHAPHQCVVCDFLAHAPLPPPEVALIPGGELLPGVALPAADLCWQRAATTHLPRGPPAQG